MRFLFVRAAVLLLLFALPGLAGEKTLLHCFYFTPIAEASQAEWDAFYKATDELPGKLDCMEFADEAALKAYAAHTAHDAWLKAYEKVRVAGTTTFDIVGR